MLRPCRRSQWLRWGERKPKPIVRKIFRERYPNQVLYFVKVNTNGKLETRKKGIVGKCSDLTCTKSSLSPKDRSRGGVNVGHSLGPLSHFMLAARLHIVILSGTRWIFTSAPVLYAESMFRAWKYDWPIQSLFSLAAVVSISQFLVELKEKYQVFEHELTYWVHAGIFVDCYRYDVFTSKAKNCNCFHKWNM